MSSVVGRGVLWVPWLQPERETAAQESVERAGGSGNPSRYVTVYVAGSLPEAHVIKGKLETEDIPVLLRYGSGATVFGLVGVGLGAVEVQVPRLLEEQARTLIEEDWWKGSIEGTEGHGEEPEPD